MTKRVLIVFMAIVLFQGVVIKAKDEVKKEVPKKIVKLMKKGLKYLVKANKAIEQEKKDEFIKDAIEKYNEVLKIDNKYAPAYFQLALINNTKKDFNSTVECLEKTISADATHIKAKTLLALLYYEQGRAFQQKKNLKKALEYMEKFVDMPIAKEKMNDKYSITLYIMGYIHSNFKNYKVANECFKKHIEMFKDKKKTETYYFAVYMVGINIYTDMESLIIKNNLTKNIKKLKGFISNYPDVEKYLEITVKAPMAKWTESACFSLLKYYIYKGDKAKAKAMAEELIEKYPQSNDLGIYKGLLKNQISKMK